MMKNDLKKLDGLLGTLSVEEDGMISYVASDIEDQLRSSYRASAATLSSSINRSKDFFQPDVMLLEDIETEGELF